MGWMELETAMQGLLEQAQASTGADLPTGLGLAGAVVVLVNLVNCFFGYRLFRIMVAVIGGMAGAAVGLTVGLILDRHGLALLLMAGLAVLFAVLAFRVYQIGVFLYCGALPGVAAALFLGPLFGVVAFVALGVLGVMLARPYLIGVSAVSSGLTAGSALLSMWGVASTAAAFGLGAVLAALGAVFQWRTTKKMPDRPTRPPRGE